MVLCLFRRFQRIGVLSTLSISTLSISMLSAGFLPASAQTPDTLPTPAELKKMSLEELMDINVTLVSKHSERLTEAASSVQVITQDDIRRFGALTLPEALRLATNLQVAQVDADRWAISARGQNNILSNKLLVMIDGRSVYTPLYAGVFWDVQNMVLDNIERIEVISGPGGTLWGANAVNGVINIVTKGSEFSQGGLVGGSLGIAVQDLSVGPVVKHLAVGMGVRDLAALRYGGKIGPDTYYRVWGRWMDHNSTRQVDGKDGGNPWTMLQGGFQMDWLPRKSERLMVSGNLYTNDLDQDRPDPTQANGQNLMVRWSRDFSEASGVQVQAYTDRAVRDIKARWREDLKIHDIDFQHRLPLGGRNALIWGAGYRLMQDDLVNSAILAFLPAHKDMNLFNAFAQDEVTLVKERLKLDLGAKWEHNSYSGTEWMPSGRLAFTPDSRQTLWGAVSRAVRSPSRIDADLFLPIGPVKSIRGGSDFKSETLLAYEAGYRLMPAENITLSLSVFYDEYDDLRILKFLPDTNYVFENGKAGEIKGVEFSGGYQALDCWQLRGGYTFLWEKFWDKPGHEEVPNPGSQGNDPEHQFLIQSMLDLPMGFQFNQTVRYVAELPYVAVPPDPAIPDYLTFDLSASWRYRELTLTLVGHDLAETNHREFLSDKEQNQVPRSVSLRAGWRF
jgi:iron complex outermembrane recepter protein